MADDDDANMPIDEEGLPDADDDSDDEEESGGETGLNEFGDPIEE